MTNPIDNPHDALFKAAFSDLRLARVHLEAVLPAELVAAADFDGLRLEPTETHDDDLRKRTSDLVFSLPLSVGGERRAQRVLVLNEHRSSPYRFLALRVLEYIVRIWRGQEKQSGQQRLDPVYPIVLYHGDRPWSAGTRVTDLVAFPPGLEHVLRAASPEASFQLVDLTRLAPERLPGRGFARLVLELLARHKEPGFEEAVLSQLDAWSELHLDDDDRDAMLFRAAITYILEVSNRSEDALHALISRRLEPVLGQAVEDEVMTAAQQIRQKGRVEGRIEGRVEGRIEGRIESVQKNIVAVLTKRGFTPTAEQLDRIATCNDLARLERWLLEAVVADSVEDALA